MPRIIGEVDENLFELPRIRHTAETPYGVFRTDFRNGKTYPYAVVYCGWVGLQAATRRRVQAMVGGFSFDQSQFNRATQAMRQPGSSFKPIVYATALDNGYTPSTVVMDAPLEIDQGPGMPPWRPENYGGKFYGPSTLRFGIEQSRNVMTVRLAQDVGMPLIGEYAKRFGTR